MKTIIRLISVMLVACFCISILASCGEDNNTETQKEQVTEVIDNKETKIDETEPESDAETEPAPETEPEKDLVLYDVYRWDFDDASKIGWIASSMTDLTAGEDGIIRCDVKGTDPHISTKDLAVSIDCDKVDFITIRLKNCTDSTDGQLFVSTSYNPGISELDSCWFYYNYFMDEDEWETVTIDVVELNGWSGQLLDLRFDYTAGEDGYMLIDYIALQSLDPENEGAVSEIKSTDPRAGKHLLFSYDFSTLTANDLWLLSKDAEPDAAAVNGDAGDDPRWVFSLGVADARIENECLVVTSGGMDPYFASPKAEFPYNCSDISAVVIKICNKTDMKIGQFFYICDGAGYSEAASFKYYYEYSGADNTEWEEIVIDTSRSLTWSGLLEKIRLDPTESRSGECWIKSIEFYG